MFVNVQLYFVEGYSDPIAWNACDARRNRLLNQYKNNVDPIMDFIE